MFVLEMRADDVHAVLGRLMDMVRMAGIPLAGIEATAGMDDYAIRLRLGTEDREAVERLARRAGGIHGADGIEVIRPRPSFHRASPVGDIAWA